MDTQEGHSGEFGRSWRKRPWAIPEKGFGFGCLGIKQPRQLQGFCWVCPLLTTPRQLLQPAQAELMWETWSSVPPCGEAGHFQGVSQEGLSLPPRLDECCYGGGGSRALIKVCLSGSCFFLFPVPCLSALCSVVT